MVMMTFVFYFILFYYIFFNSLFSIYVQRAWMVAGCRLHVIRFFKLFAFPNFVGNNNKKNAFFWLLLYHCCCCGPGCCFHLFISRFTASVRSCVLHKCVRFIHSVLFLLSFFSFILYCILASGPLPFFFLIFIKPEVEIHWSKRDGDRDQ